MGYRSEVHIAVPKRDEKELDAIMNEHKLLEGDYPPFTKEDYTQKWVRYNDNDDLVDESTEYAIYHGNHLRWHEGFKDVDAVNSFIEDMAYDCCADDEFNVFGRTMVCIGEDNAIHGAIGDYYEIFNINMVVELQ
tara:strand:+ start:575 stop:979 length:405 start_codon:yes stop_codon:yes gene_type:complete